MNQTVVFPTLTINHFLDSFCDAKDNSYRERIMAGHFIEKREKLNGLARKLGSKLPAALSAFSGLHKEALKDGALSRKHKELTALGIAICSHCEGCIAYHVHDALKAGASEEELIETIGVAVMMGGGPSMVFGSEALEAIEQFKSA